MNQKFFMGNLPDNIKKIIASSLERGELPRSKSFEKLNFTLPNWDKHTWKSWAESNGIKLPENF